MFLKLSRARLLLPCIQPFLADLLALSTALAFGCTAPDQLSMAGEPPDGPGANQAGLVQNGSRAKPIRNARGQTIPRDIAGRSTDALARSLALSLNHASVRSAIRADLLGSPYGERKLPFARLLEVGRPEVLARMASSGGKSVPALQVALDSTAQLEMYMPVHGHLDAWDGGEGLQVAYQLNDGDSIIAYTLSGERRILSEEVVPAIPTLVLVSAETDFSGSTANTICNEESCGGDGGGGSSGGLGAIYAHLYMTSLELNDLHEGWPRGDPEIEVFVLGKDNPQNNNPRAYGCASEHSYWPSHNFDMNSYQWTGEVKLASHEELQAIAEHDSLIAIGIWEDDAYPCVIYESGEWEETLAYVIGYLGLPIVGNLLFTSNINGNCWDPQQGKYVACAAAWWQYVLILYGALGAAVNLVDLINQAFGAGDDFVGVAASSVSYNQLMGTSIGQPLVILRQEGQFVGTMNVEFRTSEYNDH